MKTNQIVNATPRPWAVDSESGRFTIKSPSNIKGWKLTGIHCHKQINGSGPSCGRATLVSEDEAQANAALIVQAVNERDALIAVADAAEGLEQGLFRELSASEMIVLRQAYHEAAANLASIRASKGVQ